MSISSGTSPQITSAFWTEARKIPLCEKAGRPITIIAVGLL
jgi:hypothetical protein